MPAFFLFPARVEPAFIGMTPSPVSPSLRKGAISVAARPPFACTPTRNAPPPPPGPRSITRPRAGFLISQPRSLGLRDPAQSPAPTPHTCRARHARAAVRGHPGRAPHKRAGKPAPARPAPDPITRPASGRLDRPFHCQPPTRAGQAAPNLYRSRRQLWAEQIRLERIWTHAVRPKGAQQGWRAYKRGACL